MYFFIHLIQDVGKVDYSRRSSKNQSLCNFTCGVSTSPIPPIDEIYQRRVRCGVCHACTITEDCGGCQICLAKQKLPESKEGNTRKRVCVVRDCLRPQLSTTANCDECGKDGWGESPNPFQIMGKPKHGPSNLMECIMCLKIVHPPCCSPPEVIARSVAILNEDLPNSWECPSCVEKCKPSRGVKRMKSHEEKHRNHISENNFVSSTNSNSSFPEVSNGNGSQIGGDVKLSTALNGTTTMNNILNGKSSVYSTHVDVKPDIGDTIVKQEISEGIEKMPKKMNMVDRSVSNKC